MTRITGQEPDHWHTEDGMHRMPDPRLYGRWGHDKDTRAYAAHLTEHDQNTECPDRLSSDPRPVHTLFDLIDSRTEEIRKMRLLITALRQKFAQATEADGKDEGP